MEALLEKEGDVENWCDDRLDEMSQTMKEGFAKVDRRFERVEERFERVEGEMIRGFARVEDRFDRLNRTLLIGALGVIAALIANGVFG